MIDLLGTAAVIIVIGAMVHYATHRKALKCYRDAIFHIVAILDLSIEEWHRKYGKGMDDKEWYGFNRGYQQGLVDALKLLDYKMQIRVHGNRLQPTPGEEESLSDYANR